MIVVHDYRDHRIHVEPVAANGRYNAEVIIRRLFSQEKAHRETVTCLKITPDLAERAGEVFARRWIDLRASEDQAARRRRST